jgi:hypothetical protein
MAMAVIASYWSLLCPARASFLRLYFHSEEVIGAWVFGGGPPAIGHWQLETSAGPPVKWSRFCLQIWRLWFSASHLILIIRAQIIICKQSG